MTAEAIRLFLAAKEVKGLSTRSIRGYGSYLGSFQQSFPEIPLTPEPIEAWLLQKGPSLETRDTYYRRVRTFYNWLVKRKRITPDDNPIPQIEIAKPKHKHPRGLTLDELRKLLLCEVGSLHVRVFIRFLTDTGIRLSEALSVTPNAFHGDTVEVIGKVGEREVPISPQIRDEVLSVLPWPWASRDAAGLAVRRQFKRAGMTGRRSSAQSIRVTFARMWTGDETLLVGIMGWTTGRMLYHYRKYNVHRAIEQHKRHSPLHLAELLDREKVAA